MRADDEALSAEVERRIAALRADPTELLQRFDRNGDGVLDHEEWRAARAVVVREVAAKAIALETLEERYRLIAPIGSGAQGCTYLAVDEPNDRFVAVKEVDFSTIHGWDSVEQFERESRVLGGLDHPTIPRFLDSFRVESSGMVRLFLVQEFIEGDNLEVHLRDGRLFDEPTLRRFAEEILEILSYLHGHSPPVLHRDLKPANIIQRPDGALALVDFGAAESAERSTTVIGTSGYMPAEQLMGRATPVSDLYGLGATLIHLATRRHPSELQNDALELEWREFASLHDPFARWIERLTAPMPEDRCPSADAALAHLRRLDERGKATLVPAHGPTLALYTTGMPRNSRIQILRSDDALELSIPFRALDLVPIVVLLVTILVATFAYLGPVGLLGLLLFIPIWWNLPAHTVRLDQRGLTAVSPSRRPLWTPLTNVAGPELRPHQSENEFHIVLREGRPVRLRSCTADDARWASAVIREFLVEQRMRGDRE